MTFNYLKIFSLLDFILFINPLHLYIIIYLSLIKKFKSPNFKTYLSFHKLNIFILYEIDSYENKILQVKNSYFHSYTDNGANIVTQLYKIKKNQIQLIKSRVKFL